MKEKYRELSLRTRHVRIFKVRFKYPKGVHLAVSKGEVVVSHSRQSAQNKNGLIIKEGEFIDFNPSKKFYLKPTQPNCIIELSEFGWNNKKEILEDTLGKENV